MFTCENARSLVSSYLDGELSEEQAGPLRTHLFDCPACRAAAQDERNLKAWFPSEPAESTGALAPAGFAARVAQAAFASAQGPPSEADVELVPQPARGSVPREATILPFVLKLSAAAAGLLFVFAFLIRDHALPGGDSLDARSLPPWQREAQQSELDRVDVPVLPAPVSAPAPGQAKESEKDSRKEPERRTERR